MAISLKEVTELVTEQSVKIAMMEMQIRDRDQQILYLTKTVQLFEDQKNKNKSKE